MKKCEPSKQGKINNKNPMFSLWFEINFDKKRYDPLNTALCRDALSLVLVWMTSETLIYSCSNTNNADDDRLCIYPDHIEQDTLMDVTGEIQIICRVTILSVSPVYPWVTNIWK